DLLPTDELRHDAVARVFDAWAGQLVKAGKWQQALEKYIEGLKECPNSYHLTNNAEATVDRWAGPAISAKNWDEAIRIYKQGLTYVPDSRHLKHNLEYCEHKKGE